MDTDAKKTALRMIPYGLYILTAEGKDGRVAAAAVNWVTQTSFSPPLIVVGVKTDSLAFHLIKETGTFALNMLGKGQQDLAFNFFRSHERDGQTIGGEPFEAGKTGAPLLKNLPAFVECRLSEMVEIGDHATVIGEVVNAGINTPPQGRPDEAILWLKELGEKVFYGG